MTAIEPASILRPIFAMVLTLMAAVPAAAEDLDFLASEPTFEPYETAFEVHPLSLDPAHIRAGKQSFRMVVDGRQVGLSTVETELRDGHFVIRSQTRAEPDLREDVLIRLDGETFAPRDAWLSSHAGGRYLHASYQIDGQSLRGSTSHYNMADGKLDAYPVDRELPEGTFLRGSAFALAQAMPMGREEPIPFNWFAPEQGALALAWLEVTGTETVTVPAGTFETYRVVQKDGMVNMVLSITTEAPRRLVRAYSEGGPFVLELMP